MSRKYYLGGIGLIGIMLLTWLLRSNLTLANFTMIYILVVLLFAIRLGTIPAMITALISFLSINYFLTQPYYTFLVADSRDVIELVVFIVVAVLAGQLGARTRLQTQEAQQRAYEQEILYRLTGSMNQAMDPRTVHESLTQMMYADLSAQHAYILPHKDESLALDEPTQYLLLQAGDRIYGTLCVTFESALTQQQIRLLQTCASQAAMALQRIELAEKARESQRFEEADRLKTAILRAVSHDLRTPITIIKTSASNLQLLGERLQTGERQELAETIESEADHLNKLVGNLLDLSRLQAGALTLNKELNSLEEVTGDITARIWQLTGTERIHVQFPENMPMLCFDYGLILQALSNLVDNALQYEPAESQIEIRACVDKSQVQLKIINHGATISPEDRSHITDPFYHGKNGHIGLGLAIAKGIIETHHGSLRLEDTIGGGATFILALPLETEEFGEHETQNTRH